MNLLLTGASGFVGRNVILRAPEEWRIGGVYARDRTFTDFVARTGKPNVTAIQCDLSDAEQVRALCREHGAEWDCVLHLAAKVDIPWSVEQPQQDLMLNTGTLLNLLDCVRTPRFVYFSSGAVYDGLSGEVHPDSPISPSLPYAISKLASEQYVRFFARRRSTLENYLIVRFFGAYGPYEAAHKIYTRLLQAFAVEGKREYTIYGDGTNLIDAMYIDDAVTAILRMLTGSYWNATVNLAAGSPRTIEDLVREIAEVLAPGTVTIRKTGVAHESNNFWGSAAEMRDHFEFTPSVDLREGMLRFRDFYCSPQGMRHEGRQG